MPSVVPPIPKGFQPIAGGERSDTTGEPSRVDPYPEGIEAALDLEPVPHISLKTIPEILRVDEWLQSLTG